MANSIVLMAILLLPTLVMAARPNRNPFVVRGRVYCDTCRAGFETPASTYIPGAVVKLECKDRRSMELVYSHEARTDSTGAYKIWVNEDHEDQLCDIMLVKSPQLGCSKVSHGRERARVTLTRYNGIASDDRYVNNMGFERDEALSGCSEIMRQYQENEE
ncbi:PREDICTED: major pollen allergen Lol p 11 [Tarenaya hassleriana]|uniref:major pollen allergen Lol p 11 n=1 Tax=Tarenaya hassleriana TaxID=28532 RepID=UPI00053C7BEC|nr:PREDICTED: major pollen allergen Lol p 11 [Tarenaya hassleriana]